MISLSAERSPGLLKVVRESDPDHVLLDGTPPECDRAGDSRADHSVKHHRHGMNAQPVTDHRALPAARAPAEHGVARLKSWRR